MAGWGVITLLGAATIGAAWLLSRCLVWSDARPQLPPLSVYGDWIAIPQGFEVASGNRLGLGEAGGNASDLATQNNDVRTRHGSAV